MASDAEVWWSVMRSYAPLQPYFKYLGITGGGSGSVLRKLHDGWRGLLLQDDPKYPPCAISGRKSDLNPACALRFFEENYPLDVGIWRNGVYYPKESTTEPVTTLPSIYGGQYVADSEPVTVVPITPVSTVQPQQEHVISLSSNTSKIINDIANGLMIIPNYFYHNIEWVKSGQINESTFLTAYNDLINRHIIHEASAEPEPTPEPIPEPIPEPVPEQTWSGWVTKPSGKVEQITLTITTMQRLIEEGWIFTPDKPPEPEPKNQNISIVFYIGKGGDLKTHFGINSIVITPDEAEKLASWLSQNYNTKILLVTNRLTDDVRTHTLQQIKELIVQKLKDDQPEADDITPDDIKKPLETGFMGAGMMGAIAGLVLLGFIVDHKVGKT